MKKNKSIIFGIIFVVIILSSLLLFYLWQFKERMPEEARIQPPVDEVKIQPPADVAQKIEIVEIINQEQRRAIMEETYQIPLIFETQERNKVFLISPTEELPLNFIDELVIVPFEVYSGETQFFAIWLKEEYRVKKVEAMIYINEDIVPIDFTLMREAGDKGKWVGFWNVYLTRVFEGEEKIEPIEPGEHRIVFTAEDVKGNIAQLEHYFRVVE